MTKLTVLFFLILHASLHSQAQELASLKKSDLSADELEAFRQEALKKVESLSEFLVTITDKPLPATIKMDAISAALRLFMDEDQLVEVSVKNKSKVTTYKVRQYLNALRIRTNYNKVRVEWYNISYIRDFKKGTDGKYYATVTIFQKFTGYGADGTMKYEDITQKNIGVVLATVGKKIGDRVVTKWDVLLRDISVVETK